jgi:predicted N-acetyltransferase YhbS
VNPYRLRAATAHDAVRLTVIAREAKASWGYPAEWLEEWRPQLEFTRESIERSYVRVVESGGEAVAVGALDEPAGPVAEIDHLWVLLGHHGQGVGRRLVAELLHRARAQHYTSVAVLADPGARAFYERLGARYRGEEPAHVCGIRRTLPRLVFDVR